MGSFGSECAWLFGFGASSDSELEMTSKGVRTSPAATLERVCSGDSFVPVDSYTELDARRRYTLYARRKGMRGRLRWFTPSRPAGGLNTAKIGRGHGGSTQPIRC